jgi:hypothetical protein
VSATPTKTVLDVLREARELYAANPSHAPYGCTPGAEYCIVTACYAADCGYGGGALDALKAAVDATEVDRAEFNKRIISWNAEHTTEEVLEAWDRAIASLEAEAA